MFICIMVQGEPDTDELMNENKIYIAPKSLQMHA